MYTRSHGRFPRGMRVPENYSGNAFRVEPEEPTVEDSPKDEPAVSEREQESPAGTHEQAKSAPTGLSLPRFRFSSSQLFSRLTGSGIGFEELLLVGLILLLAEDGGNDDLILLLILLLFVS